MLLLLTLSACSGGSPTEITDGPGMKPPAANTVTLTIEYGSEKKDWLEAQI